MRKITQQRRSITESTVKKSVAIMALAWDVMNLDHEGPVRNRIAAFVSKDRPHRRRGDPMAKSQYLTVESPVPPWRILGVQTQHELFQLGVGRRPVRAILWG